MSGIKTRFSKVIAGMEDNFDDLTFALRKRLQADAPLQIVTYRSYGTVNRLYVKGRILEDKGILKSTEKDTVWNNLLSMYKRFESDEIRGAQLTMNFQGRAHLTTSDDEGYFTVNLLTEQPIVAQNMWYEVDVELIEAPSRSPQKIKSTAHVLVPPADAEYGIISDIDDTVVKTSATNLLSMARNTFFHNAHTRLPFAGVSEFYKSLQLGRNGRRNNPFFYVSSSPWNLYDLLVDFLDLNEIPEGPLLLRDFGLNDNNESDSHMSHKFKEIKNILEAYPHLKFVLVGDSGQEDPKIYREVVSKYPGRILAIYIRDVQLADREKIATDISEAVAKDKVELVVVDNTVEAAEHASERGLIYGGAISKVIEDKRQDKGEVGGKAAL